MQCHLWLLLVGLCAVQICAMDCKAQIGKEEDPPADDIFGDLEDDDLIDLRLLRDIEGGLDIITKRIDKAIAEDAPEQTIVNLRLEKAIIAQSWGERNLDWRPAHEALDQLIDDPGEILSSFVLAKMYVKAVSIRCEVLGSEFADPGLQYEAIQNAVDEVEAAMRLREDQRNLLSINLREIGSKIACEKDNYDKAVFWLGPIMENGTRLADGFSSASEFSHVVRQQVSHLSRLGRLEECSSVFEIALRQFMSSKRLSEPERLAICRTLIADQLGIFADKPTHNGATVAWQAAVTHLQHVDAYQGLRVVDARVGGLFVRQAMIEFLQARDLENSAKILGDIFQTIELDNRLLRNASAVACTVTSANSVLGELVAAKDRRRIKIREWLKSYFDKLEQAGFGKSAVDKYKAKIRNLTD